MPTLSATMPLPDLHSFDPLHATKDAKTAAQIVLQKLGYYTAKIDGLWGPKSDSAWGRELRDFSAATRLTGSPILAQAVPQTILTPDSLPLWYPPDNSKIYVDVYHLNNPFNIDSFIAGGGRLAILKATQDTPDRFGSHATDPAYEDWRSDCEKRNFPYVSYHFSGPSPSAAQFLHFWTTITANGKRPSGRGALDWENSDGTGKLPNMSPVAAAAFVQAFFNAAKMWPLLYGNNLIREGVGFTHVHPIFRFCPLWLVDIRKYYRDVPTKTWPMGPTFWQIGEDPHGVDINRFRGSKEDFDAANATDFQIPTNWIAALENTTSAVAA